MAMLPNRNVVIPPAMHHISDFRHCLTAEQDGSAFAVRPSNICSKHKNAQTELSRALRPFIRSCHIRWAYQ